jgi:hypothetical protein
VKLEILRGNLQPVVLDDVSRILVTTDDGTPLTVTCEWSPGTVIASHAGEGGKFTQVLAALGIDRTVVATPLDAPK